MNEEERWFDAHERLRSNMHLLNSSIDQSDERNQILSFLEEICVTINNFIKTQPAASPIFTLLIQSFIDLLNCKNINKKVIIFSPLYYEINSRKLLINLSIISDASGRRENNNYIAQSK